MTKTNGQLEEILRQMGQKMDHLIDEMKQHTNGVSEEMEKQIKNLKEKIRTVDAEAGEIGTKAKERWENAKPHIDEALKEMGQAFKRFSGK